MPLPCPLAITAIVALISGCTSATDVSGTERAAPSPTVPHGELVLPEPGKADHGRPPEIALAYNNGLTLVELDDGTLVTVYVLDGVARVLRQAASGEESTTVPDSSAHSIAVDGTGQVLLATWADSTQVKAAWSSDGGLSWEPAAVLATGARPTAPAARVWTRGEDLRANVAWHVGQKREGHEVWAASWVAGTWVTSRIDAGDGSWAALADHDDTAWAVWKDQRDSSQRGNWLYMSSRPGDSTSWSGERALGFDGSDPSLCISSDGTMHLGYQVLRRIYYRRSDDDGRSWSTAQVVPGGSGHFAHVLCEGDDVALVWERFEGADMYEDTAKTIGLVVSHDRGSTFTEGTVDDRAGLARPAATLAADGGIRLCWVDRNGEHDALEFGRANLGTTQSPE